MGVIDEKAIARAVQLLQQAAPGAKVIVFGSYARAGADDRSDLDFLVVEPDVQDASEEMVRLLDVLRPLRIPADVLVTSWKTFEYWADTPGTVYYEAAREGRAFDALL